MQMHKGTVTRAITTRYTYEPKKLRNSQPESSLTRRNAFAQRVSARSLVQDPRGTRRFFSARVALKKTFHLLDSLKGFFSFEPTL